MIAIVGAGLAGLAAAYKLVQSGCQNFILLESQDVVGGRVRSGQLSDGTRLDLGAQWLHGHEQNPIYAWLKSLDCIDRVEEEEAEFEGLFVTDAGEKVPPQIVSKTLEVLLDTKNQLYQYASMAHKDCLPLDIFRGSMQDAVAKCPVLRETKSEIIEAIQRWFELYEAIDNSCESLNQLSMRAYSDWSDFDDGKMVRLKGGWQRVVDELKFVIEEERLLLNSEVQRVDLQPDGKIRLNISSQDDMLCDHIILTPSVGVMKRLVHPDSGFFSPKLDEDRCRRIEKLGFGPVNKIFLEFSEPYLQEEAGLKVLHTRSHELNNNADPSTKLQNDTELDWIKGVMSFDLLDEAPNVLMIWIGGSAAASMEGISDHDLSQSLMRLLTNCLPEKPPPKLISITRSEWSRNLNIGGAYSYPSVASQREDMRNLWDPVCDSRDIPRILFAGEATAGDMYATAHGAILSGWREADRILKSMSQQQQEA